MKRLMLVVFVACLSVACLVSAWHVTAARRDAPAPAAAGAGNTASVVALPATSAQLRQIRTEQVTNEAVPEDELVAPGRITVNANRVSRVALPLPGRVVRVLVQLGDSVSAGQPLVTLDSHEADSAVSEYERCQAARVQARAAVDRARHDLDRVRDLVEHKAAAAKELLYAEHELTGANATLAQAEAECTATSRHLQLLGLRPGERDQQVVVRAPFAGKVLEIAVAPGEYRSDTTAALMTVADLSTVWVTSDVSERDISLVEVGEQVSVELVSYPGETFEARVRRIADTVDARTRTIQVQAEMSNPGGRLRPEMFGRIRHSHGSKSVPVVPVTAILQSSEGASVFVERSRGRFERVKVTPGTSTAGRVAILNGLTANDRIVVGGAQLLTGQAAAGDAR